MASFDVVNYSVRPNKSVQRAIVFGCIQRLLTVIGSGNSLFVGLGSIWFADFQIAHKRLNIRDLISFEQSDIGAARAVFNKPFSAVEVRHGTTNALLPDLLADPRFADYTWVVWLDYDGRIDEEVLYDLRILVESVPRDSIVVTTFNSDFRRYGRNKARPTTLHTLFDSVLDDKPTQEECNEENFAETLSDLVGNYMQSTAVSAGRKEVFRLGFDLRYVDSTPMSTVGGICVSTGVRGAVDQEIGSADWEGVMPQPINIPPLTFKEAAALQSILPSATTLKREDVQKLGFDLPEEKIRAFERFYRYYPAFAEVVV